MYNPESLKAEEFISHEEILSTLEYAEANKNNIALIDEISTRQNCARVFPIAKLRFCWPVNWRTKTRKSVRWPNR